MECQDIKGFKSVVIQLVFKTSFVGSIIQESESRQRSFLYPQNGITMPNEKLQIRKYIWNVPAKHRLDDNIKINHKNGKNKLKIYI